MELTMDTASIEDVAEYVDRWGYHIDWSDSGATPFPDDVTVLVVRRDGFQRTHYLSAVDYREATERWGEGR